MVQAQTTAALLIIGNEILSGRTQDRNIAFLGKALNECGVRMLEVRVVPDIACEIIDALNTLREKFDYVFTTGGIGPTHDDITAQSVADAFGVALEKHEEAFSLLEEFYAEREQEFNEARQKMAYIPHGARLIANPVTTAPGFNLENVYVMAGVPKIMQGMFEGFRHELKGGSKMVSKSVMAMIRESEIAKMLEECETRYVEAGLEIGSYPQMKDGVLSTCVVLRCLDAEVVEKSYQDVVQWLGSSGFEFMDEL